MELLQTGDGRVVKILYQKEIELDQPLKLSLFVYPYETEEAVLLKNTLTRQVCRLTNEEWDALRTGRLPGEIQNKLLSLHYLVERDTDELAQYNMVLSVLRIMEKKEPGIVTYTVLPTTGCNARCIYCYEEGWQSRTMSLNTANAVVDFICRTKRAGKIRLDWFGGEPLCGAGTISHICQSLKTRGVEYYSTIITNGTLFSQQLVEEAVELWNLKRAQISMDGSRRDYESRKRFVDPERCNYETALCAVDQLSARGVSVMLRCNYDADNLPRVKEFFDDCKSRFGKRDNISYYMEQLFQSDNAEGSASLFRTAAQVAKYLDELGLPSTERIGKRLKIHYCMADSGGQSVIIDPDGGLHLCEHDIQGKPFGTVFNHCLAWPAENTEIERECESCCFLPECTPFRKSKCLLKISACQDQMAVRTERALSSLLCRKNDGEYEADSVQC